MHTTKKPNCLHLSILFCSVIIFSCAAPQVVEMDTPPPSVKYIIGSEDILQINVWKEPELSMTVPVRIDGKISLPLIHDVQATGLTPQQLKNEITKKLTKFIEDPTVSVIVQTINSHKIFLVGNVNAPGVYQIGREINILQALSLGGGLTDWAKKNKITITRKDGDIEKTLQVNYNNIIKGKEPNTPIYPGDTIIVP